MLYGLLPSKVRGTLGVNVPAEGVSTGQAIGVELVLTFLLVLTVFGCTDPLRSHYGYEVPLAIGLCVTICNFVGVGATFWQKPAIFPGWTSLKMTWRGAESLFVSFSAFSQIFKQFLTV